MAYADAVADVAGHREVLRCPERASALPTGVDAVQEVKGEEPCGVSCARTREEVEAIVAMAEAEARRLTVAMAALVTVLAGGDTYARAVELIPLIAAGVRPGNELVELFRCGFRRVQAARTLQAAVRCRLRRPLGPLGEPYAYQKVAVVPGSVEMWEQKGAFEVRLQRLRHGACGAWEVHAAAGRSGLSLKRWLASEPAARRTLWCVPKPRRTPLAVRMRRGADAAIAASVGLARAHAARRVQLAFRLLQMRRLILLHAAGQAQLKAWCEARKVRRKAARAHARAGGDGTVRSDAQAETAVHVAATVDEGRAAFGRAGEGADWARHWCAVGALLVAVAAWGLAAGPTLVPSTGVVHRLPRPPGVRFDGSGGGPSAVDLRLQCLWLQACPAVVLADAQGAGEDGRGERGRSCGCDGWGRVDGRAFDGQPRWLAFQPAALREALRLRDGPWGLPRPPEWKLIEYGWRQARAMSADAGDVDSGESVVARWLTGVLIVVELLGLCKRVSRWPGHAAWLCGWWKGHPEFVHPGVVPAACALACAFYDQGIRRVSPTTGSLGDACQWRRGCRSRAPDEYMLARWR